MVCLIHITIEGDVPSEYSTDTVTLEIIKKVNTIMLNISFMNICFHKSSV